MKEQGQCGKVTLHTCISNIWAIKCNRASVVSDKIFQKVRERLHDDNMCSNNLIILSPNFHENMHDFRSILFAGCQQTESGSIVRENV